MAKPKKDPRSEDRIHNEVNVDTYGPEEQALGWYYYPENKMRFPFQAKCLAAKVVSPVETGDIRVPENRTKISELRRGLMESLVNSWQIVAL
jgi:hypothetical protein